MNGRRRSPEGRHPPRAPPGRQQVLLAQTQAPPVAARSARKPAPSDQWADPLGTDMSTLASFLQQVNDAGSLSRDARQGVGHDVDLLTVAAITVAGMLGAAAVKATVSAVKAMVHTAAAAARAAATATAFLGVLAVVAVVLVSNLR